MSVGKRSTLGRGLEALFGDPVVEDGAGAGEGGGQVATDLLSPNPFQPRRRFEDSEIAALADSIKAQGVLQPILVRPDPAREGRYQIIAGERRWRAAQRAGLHETPVVVRALSDHEAAHIAVVENVQRQDLTPIEEAEGYRRLIDEFGQTQEALARTVGKSRPHIANMLRLLDLPSTVRQMVQSGTLSAGHARALLGATDAEEMAQIVVARGLSVRQTEALMRDGAAPRGRSAPTVKDADTLALERELSASTGVRVTIDHRPGAKGGRMIIDYRTLDQLDALSRKLTG